MEHNNNNNNNNKTFTATFGCFKGSNIPNALGHLKYKVVFLRYEEY